MNRKYQWITAAALAAALIGAMSYMAAHHADTVGVAPSRAQVIAAPPLPVTDEQVVHAIRTAGIDVAQLQVRSLGGIVILRGTADTAAAERAAGVVRGLGVTRVANLITPGAAYNDDELRREAERELAGTGALAGCIIRVSCDNGVVRVTGTVKHDSQRDAAQNALRGMRGVQDVRVDLTKVKI